ncbi:MAG TPA: sulfurtransferase [Nitrososphaerales archaeon]|nr:sulfurtransferase [Nitrososphaerales archaeon]
MPNYKGYENPSLVISVEEARKLMGKPDVIFIDTRNYWKYAKGHIPGAFNLELFAFHWVDTSREGMKAFVKEMQMLFGSLGISPKSSVIFYQNISGYDAARGVWLLNLLGHDKARMLDGGLNLWRRLEYPTNQEDPEPRKGQVFSDKINEEVLATRESLTASLSHKSAQVLDVRKDGEYDATYRRARKSGHIPSALNLDWTRALRRDGTLKIASDLEKLYSFLDPKKKTITYCQSGYRAAHSWLLLKSLGFENVQNYLGSWYEWGNDPKTPVEK